MDYIKKILWIVYKGLFIKDFGYDISLLVFEPKTHSFTHKHMF